MSIHAAQIRAKLNIGSRNVKKAYKGAGLVYSSGSSVTYHVDTGITYREEINEGESCLSPKTFTPAKSGWEFAGWRQDTAAPAAGSVESSVPMGSSPVTLYAVFRKLITVTYYNNSTSASSTSRYRYYNNGNVVNPSFTLTQASSSWTPRGWSTSNQGNAGITYANGATFTRDSDITLYGLYQQTVTVTYYNNSTTASATTGTRYWAPAGSINPSFALSQAALSGWTARGWSTSNGATAGITYNNGASFTRDSNITLYGMYYQTITLTTYNGSSSPTAHNGTRYYCPGSGSVVNPTFTVSAAALSGWSFDGWSTSSVAAAGIDYNSISGLSLATNITLYGRYSQIITLSYNGNGASGGSVAAQNSVRYWNSGNVANPTFILRANGFSRSGYNFTAWALNGGTQYGAGASVTLAASATMYAVWTAIPATPFYLSSKDLTYTTSGNVESWRKPDASWAWWQVQRNGYYARCDTSAFSRQGCTKIKITCFLDGGYFYVNSKCVALHGYGSGKEVIIDISDQPDTICCAIQAEGDGKGGHYDSVQVTNPYFY